MTYVTHVNWQIYLTVILTILNLDYFMYYNENYVFEGFLISTIYLQETKHNSYKAMSFRKCNK